MMNQTPRAIIDPRRPAESSVRSCALLLLPVLSLLSSGAEARSSGLLQFLELAEERSAQIARVDESHRMAVAGAALERVATGPSIQWSALGPSWISLEERQLLFEGADYVTRDSDAISYGTLSSRRRGRGVRGW